jgi:hypothetical protein
MTWSLIRCHDLHWMGDCCWPSHSRRGSTLLSCTNGQIRTSVAFHTWWKHLYTTFTKSIVLRNPDRICAEQIGNESLRDSNEREEIFGCGKFYNNIARTGRLFPLWDECRTIAGCILVHLWWIADHQLDLRQSQKRFWWHYSMSFHMPHLPNAQYHARLFSRRFSQEINDFDGNLQQDVYDWGMCRIRTLQSLRVG